MTTLALPSVRVKTTRRAVTGPALARALDKAVRRLTDLIPGYHATGKPRRSWIERVWFPANEALDRAEKAVLGHLQRRGVGGMVAGGRLYLDLCYFLGDLSEYRGTGVLVVDLAEVPDLVGPDPDDARWNAEQNPDHHFDGPTPDEALGDGTDYPAGLAMAARHLAEVPGPGQSVREIQREWPEDEVKRARSNGGHGFGPDLDAAAALSAFLDRYESGLA